MGPANSISNKESAHLKQVDQGSESERQKWKNLFQKEFSENRVPKPHNQTRVLWSKTVKLLTSGTNVSTEDLISAKEWQKLYDTVGKKWDAANSHENKVKIAVEENLDVKLKQLAKQQEVCFSLCESIIERDGCTVLEKLEAIKDLEVFKVPYESSSSFHGSTPLNLAARTASIFFPIFLMVLEKVKQNKEILKINHPDYPTFLTLLEHGATLYAKALIEALDGDIDHLLNERSLTGSNIFHEMAYTTLKQTEEVTVEIAQILFKMPKDPKKAEAHKRKLCDLMLSISIRGSSESLPLHFAIRCENLPLTKLYIQELHKLGILDQCLKTKNENGQTPLDLLKGLHQTKNWPEDLTKL